MNMNALWESLQNSLGGHIPQLLGALAIFVLGWFIAVLVRAAVRKSLGFAGVNHRFSRLTGNGVDIEGAVALGLFWAVILVTLMAVFNSLDLAMVSGPFSALITKVFEYAPRLLAGLVLALVAWLVASLVRTMTQKLLDRSSLDEKLSEHADMDPISESLAGAPFWLVLLLFVPATLGALELQGLLSPRRTAGTTRPGRRPGRPRAVQLSSVVGLLVFVAVFLPSLIAALDALKVEAISQPATQMLAMILAAVPHILAAALILVITWLVASFASKLLASLLATVGFDTLPARIGMAHAFEKTAPPTLWVTSRCFSPCCSPRSRRP